MYVIKLTPSPWMRQSKDGDECGALHVHIISSLALPLDHPPLPVMNCCSLRARCHHRAPRLPPYYGGAAVDLNLVQLPEGGGSLRGAARRSMGLMVEATTSLRR